MNIKFLVNDYMLIWNLLFGASISEDIHKMKNKLWMNYRNQYQRIQKDFDLIIKEGKNFIPDDDTLYNLFLEAETFDIIKKEVDKYRIKLLSIWDENKKEVSTLLKEILRIDLKPYKFLLVHPNLDIIHYAKDKEQHTIVYGKNIHEDETDKIIMELVYCIVKNEIGNYRDDYKEIVQAVLELAIENEFYTRINKTSHYLMGDSTLKFLKRQIYPYWLMYLGADKEEMLRYMMRDKIAFDVDKYAIENELKKVDLYGFIDFCIKNQKYIVKINELEIN